MGLSVSEDSQGVDYVSSLLPPVFAGCNLLKDYFGLLPPHTFFVWVDSTNLHTKAGFANLRFVDDGRRDELAIHAILTNFITPDVEISQIDSEELA